MEQMEDIPHWVEKLNSTEEEKVSTEMHKDTGNEKKGQTKCTLVVN